MTEREDIDALAAEFVLGTLGPADRASIVARRQREARLELAIRDWETRLGPLNDLAPRVDPPREIWPRIEASIARDDRFGHDTAAGASSNVVDLTRRLTRWRRTAVAASALAASLMVVVGIREYGRADPPQNYVAVFQKDDASPAFLLSVDLASRQLTIRPVTAQTPPGKTYQLWIRAAQLGDKPRSLGLVEQNGTRTRAALASYDPAVVQTATFGVSLEPAGGSIQPTGPVFHATLIAATP